MDPIPYRLVFEPSFTWFPTIVYLFFPVVGLVAIRASFRSNGGRLRKAFFIMWTVVMGVVSLFGIGNAYSKYTYARDAARSTDTPMVEGIVEHFVPAVPKKRPESFTVQGIPFKVDAFVLTGGFQREGLIHEGQLVRIRYVPHHQLIDGNDAINVIVKVEIADSPSTLKRG